MADTSTIIVRPLEDYCGTVNVSTLRPWIGTDYMSIPECLDIIYDLNNWQLITAMNKVDELIKQKPQLTMDLWRLKVEVFGLYDKFQDLYDQCEIILDYLPDDPQALFLTSVYGQYIGIDLDENDHFDHLQMVQPNLAEELLDLVHFIHTHTNRTDFELELEGVEDIKLIGMFGYLVHPDGSLADTTIKRASKVLEMATRYPDAEIMVSGGAVNAPYVEATGIKNWLIDQGISENRVIIDPFAKDTVGNILAISDAIKQKDVKKAVLVTSMDHLPRCYMGTKVHLESQDIQCQLYAAAYEKPFSVEISEAEYYREIQTILRSAGYFSKNDFKKYLI